jgi:hypothetical protein
MSLNPVEDQTTIKKSTSKKKKYFFIGINIFATGHGPELLNEKVILDAIGKPVLGPATGKPVFQTYPELPRIKFVNKSKPPKDIEPFGYFWLVSDRLKNAFEALDGEAFSFGKCETFLADDSLGPQYWLCDVIRVLDAVDEEKSEIKIVRGEGDSKYYSFMGFYSLNFKSDIVLNYKIFRLLYSMSGGIICDEEFKIGCKGFTGFGFEPDKKSRAGLKGTKFDPDRFTNLKGKE